MIRMGVPVNGVGNLCFVRKEEEEKREKVVIQNQCVLASREMAMHKRRLKGVMITYSK